jgi:hypothetical protein
VRPPPTSRLSPQLVYRQKFLNLSAVARCSAPCAGRSCGRATPAAPWCRGRHWQKRSRRRAATCAGISRTAFQRVRRAEQTTSRSSWLSAGHRARRRICARMPPASRCRRRRARISSPCMGARRAALHSADVQEAGIQLDLIPLQVFLLQSQGGGEQFIGCVTQPPQRRGSIPSASA